jgi:hypothetical protein
MKMQISFSRLLRLAPVALLFCLPVTSAYAATPISIYTCELNASNAKGWIPSKFQLGIRNNRAKIKFPKSFSTPPDANDVRVVRNNDKFKEIKFTIDQFDTKKKRVSVIHNVTILPGNNKAVYVAKFKQFSNHHQARGECVVEHRYK